VNRALHNTVAPIAKRHEATLAQIALAWLLAQPGVTSVVVGASTLEQVAANARAAALALTGAEVSEIRRAFEAVQLDPNAGPSLTGRSIQQLRVRLGALRRRLSA
jgi:aryl-alcohol dehydrogenase-like predicted oxidoreductase